MKTKSFITIFLCCLLVGLGINVSAAVKQDRNVGSFTKVSVSSGIDLYLTQGNTHSVTIETEEDIINKIETTVENGTLIIKLKKGEKINWKGRDGRLTLVAHVTTPVVEHIQGSGGADIYPQTPISSNGTIGITLSGGSDLKSIAINAKVVDLKLSGGSDANQLNVVAESFIAGISGGSDINNGEIKAPTINIKQSGGSDARLNIEAESLNIEISGGSDLKLSGKTNSIVAKASGSSDLVARDLIYEKSDISKSGGSDVYLRKQ